MQVGLLTVVTEEVPRVPPDERVAVEPLKHGVYRITARYGFMDQPNAPEVLRAMKEKGLDWKLEETTFFLGRERLISTARPGLAPWRERLFAFLAHNAQPATAYFQIPPDRVIEVGSQVEI
jgi:KUP system potassium uptake protein